MDCFIFRPSWQKLEENMPAIASLEDLKAAQKDLCYSMRVCLKRPARRSGFAQAGAILKWNAPQAIAIFERSDHLEMAQDRLEEYL